MKSKRIETSVKINTMEFTNLGNQEPSKMII